MFGVEYEGKQRHRGWAALRMMWQAGALGRARRSSPPGGLPTWFCEKRGSFLMERSKLASLCAVMPAACMREWVGGWDHTGHSQTVMLHMR